jgi:hypothetical protein
VADSFPKAKAQLSGVMIPPDQVTEDNMLKAVELNKVHESLLSELVEMARKEFSRLESTSREFYMALVNPPSISLDDSKVDEIMSSLGSTKELSGAWLPVVITAKKSYYRIWGKTSYCG